MISGNLRQVFLDEKTHINVPTWLYCFINLYEFLHLKCNPNPLKTAQHPYKTRVVSKKAEGPFQGESENSRVLANLLALARPIWKYIVMYPFSPLQAI